MTTKRKRDYAAEYARRLKRALDKGYSRSIARGHAKKGEISIARAKRLHVNAGHFIEKQNRKGYRPTYADIRKRIRSLGLPLSEAILRGKKGRIPLGWTGAPGKRYLVEDETRDEFIDAYTGHGLTTNEAYTLWFSP